MRSRWSSTVVTVVLVALVNLPYLHGRWVEHRLDADGIEVTVAVTGHLRSGTAHVLELTDDRLQVEGRPVQVRVSRPTYDAAVAAGSTTATVLPDEPGQFEVPGEVTTRGPLGFALAADAVIAVALLLFSRFRPSLRPEMVLRATADLEACGPGSVLDRVGSSTTYVVAGRVLEADGAEVLVDLGDRRVRVLLDGHANPVGVREPVRATGVLIA